MPSIQRVNQVKASAEQLYSAAEVDSAIRSLAAELSTQYSANNPLLLNVLNGATPFVSALMQHLRFPLELDYIHATRYENELRGAGLQFYAKPRTPLHGRCVWVVDDIFDEGVTLAGVVSWCKHQGAKEVVTIVLADKLHSRKTSEMPAVNYAALTVPDRYVFGWGMDYQGYWRNLDEIYAIAD